MNKIEMSQKKHERITFGIGFITFSFVIMGVITSPTKAEGIFIYLMLAGIMCLVAFGIFAKLFCKIPTQQQKQENNNVQNGIPAKPRGVE